MLLLLLILSLSFGQLTRWELTPGVVIYLHDFLVLLLLIFNLRKVKTFTSPLTRPILALTLAALVSLLAALWRYSSLEVLTGSLYLVRFIAYALIYFIARQSAWKSHLPRWLALTGIAIAVTGLIQYVFLPDTRFLYDLGWDRHYYRLIGTFLDPNFTGIFLVLTLILLWPSPLSLLPFIALLLTYSRSSYLALLVVLVYKLRHQKILLFVTCSLLLVTLLLLPRPGGEGVKLERVYSLTNRLDSMKSALVLFSGQPLTGVGFNLLRPAQDNFISHSGAGIDNSFLFVLATTGIPGFLAYLWLLKKQLEISKLLAIRYSLLAILVHSLFNNSLFYAPIMLWLWLLLASHR